jgi:hypothetical protein
LFALKISSACLRRATWRLKERIIQVKSREEALEWASRIPGKDNEMVEVRRMFDMTDFDPETQKEIQKKFGDAVAAEMGQ